MCLTPRIKSDYEDHLPSLSLSHDLIDTCDYLEYENSLNEPLDDDELSIIQFNVRGLLNKQLELSELLNAKGHNKVHIAFLNETWVKEKNKNQINVPGYHYIGREHRGKNGGGVGFLIDNKL